jgi:hypothetical protein
MANAVKPAIIGSAVTAWRDAFHALRDMKALAGIAFLLMMAVSALDAAADSYLFPGDERSLAKQLTVVFSAVVQSSLATPLAIAVHRYVLLGEITRQYSIDLSDRRFLRFFGFVAALYMFLDLPISIIAALAPVKRELSEGLRFVGFFLSLVALILTVRSLILFPAIAVDAPGVSWGNALRDSRGHFWRIFLIVVVATLPTIAIVVVGVALLVVMPSLPTLLIFAVFGASMAMVFFATMAALASRLYAAYGQRLGRPPKLAAAHAGA